MEITEVNINEICRSKKAEKKLSNARIAELSNVPQPTVNSFFGPNAKSPSFDTTWKICRALGVSIDSACGINQTELPDYISEMIKELQQQIAEKEKSISFQKTQEVYLESKLSDAIKEIESKDRHIQMLDTLMQNNYKNAEMVRPSLQIAESHAKALRDNIESQKEYIENLKSYNLMQRYVIISLLTVTCLAVICSGWFSSLWEVISHFIG